MPSKGTSGEAAARSLTLCPPPQLQEHAQGLPAGQDAVSGSSKARQQQQRSSTCERQQQQRSSTCERQQQRASSCEAQHAKQEMQHQHPTARPCDAAWLPLQLWSAMSVRVHTISWGTKASRSRASASGTLFWAKGHGQCRDARDAVWASPAAACCLAPARRLAATPAACSCCISSRLTAATPAACAGPPSQGPAACLHTQHTNTACGESRTVWSYRQGLQRPCFSRSSSLNKSRPGG